MRKFRIPEFRADLKSLTEQRNDKVTELQVIVDKAKEETRAMTEEEVTKFNTLEKEICRHIVFERADLAIQLNGNPLSHGEGEGVLKISGADCSVFMPIARIQFDGTVLTALEMEKSAID